MIDLNTKVESTTDLRIVMDPKGSLGRFPVQKGPYYTFLVATTEDATEIPRMPSPKEWNFPVDNLDKDWTGKFATWIAPKLEKIGLKFVRVYFENKLWHLEVIEIKE